MYFIMKIASVILEMIMDKNLVLNLKYVREQLSNLMDGAGIVGVGGAVALIVAKNGNGVVSWMMHEQRFCLLLRN